VMEQGLRPAASPPSTKEVHHFERNYANSRFGSAPIQSPLAQEM